MQDVMLDNPAALAAFVRNRYFYGKLLDVYHFDLESNYLNGKRRLLNRMVSGYGVVCGLDVQRGPSRDSIVITPGLALDKWGNEIVVPKRTDAIPLPADIVEDYGYPPLTREDKRKILGANMARMMGISIPDKIRELDLAPTGAAS